MKNYLVFIMLFASSIFHVCYSQVVGSAVGIETVQEAIQNSVLTMFNNEISQDFTVSGDFEFNRAGLEISGKVLGSGGGNLRITEGMLFEGAAVNGFNNVSFSNGSLYRVLDTDISNVTNVIVEEGTLSVQLGSSFTNVINTEVTDFGVAEAVFVSIGSSFVDAPLKCSGGSLILTDCNFDGASLGISGTSGYIFSQRNTFINHNHAVRCLATGFLNFQDQGSTYSNVDGSTIQLLNVASVSVMDSKYIPGNNEPFLSRTFVQVEGCTGARIEGNEVTRNRLCTLRDSPMSGVKSNVVSQATVGSGSSIIFCTSSADVTITHNLMDNSLGLTGIFVANSPSSEVSLNGMEDMELGLQIIESDGCTISENFTNNTGQRAMLVTSSDDVEYCENTFSDGTLGPNFEGMNLPLDFSANTIRNMSAVGLVYDADVIAQAQIDKGNEFVGNNLGAVFGGSPSFAVLNASRYEVQNTSTQFPTHSPPGWFAPNGGTPVACSTPLDTGPLGTVLDDLMSCCNLTGQGGGTKLQKYMTVFDVVDQYPTLLNDPNVSTFVLMNSGTPYEEFPSMSDVMDDLSIFQPYTLPTQIFDSAGNVIGIQNASTFFSANEQVYNSNISSHISVLQQYRADLNAISTSTIYQSNYKTALLLYLDVLAGHVLTSSEEANVLQLAGSCLFNDGPAVYVGRTIANYFELPFTRNSGCTQVRSSATASTLDGGPKLVANLVSNTLEVRNLSFDDKVRFVITDISGRIVTQDYCSYGSIDVSTLKSGMYLIVFEGDVTTHKFVKQ